MSHLDDDDDALLMGTLFDVVENKLVKTPEKRRASKRQSLLTNSGLKDLRSLLGNDLEKDTLLASETFWDRLDMATQEDRGGQEKEKEESSDSEDEQDESELVLARIVHEEVPPVEKHSEYDALERLQLFLPFNVGSNLTLATLMKTELWTPLLAASDLAENTRLRFFDSLIEAILAGKHEVAFLVALRNAACGLVHEDTLEGCCERFPGWLKQLGLSTEIDHLISIDAQHKKKNPEWSAIPPFESTEQLRVFLAIIGRALKFGKEKTRESLFRHLLPLIFDPTVGALHADIILLLRKLLKGQEKELWNWLQALMPLLTSPIRRFCMVLRALGISRPILCECIDRFLALEVGVEELLPLDDGIFVDRLLASLDAYGKDRSLARLNRFIEPASLRLLSTPFECLSMDRWEALSEALAAAKEGVPLQPAFMNIRATDLLSKMGCHLQLYLRARKQRESFVGSDFTLSKKHL